MSENESESLEEQKTEVGKISNDKLRGIVKEVSGAILVGGGIYKKKKVAIPSDLMLKALGDQVKIKVGLSKIDSEVRSYATEQGKIDGKVNEVGEHMTITTEVYDGKDVMLSDGVIFRKGTKVGRIDLMKRLPDIEKDANMFSEIRELLKSVKVSLTELARLCQSEDPRFKDMIGFYGFSHLSGPAAEKLGFDIKAADFVHRTAGKILGKLIAYQTAGRNKDWQKYQKNFKPPQYAYISKQKLISLYGKHE